MQRDGNHAFFLDLLAGPDCPVSICVHLKRVGLLHAYARTHASCCRCVDRACSAAGEENEKSMAMAARRAFTCCVLQARRRHVRVRRAGWGMVSMHVPRPAEMHDGGLRKPCVASSSQMERVLHGLLHRPS